MVRSPRRSLVSATRLRGMSPSRVQNIYECNINDSDCNNTGCNNSSSDTGIESENEEYFSSHTDEKSLYLTVRFDSLKLSALIVSGSSVNIIWGQLYYSLPYSKKSKFNSDVNDSTVLANNHKVEVVGTAMIKMNISGTNQMIFTYILKMSSHSIIVGTNYLIENKLVIDFSEMSAVQKTANAYCLKRTTV